jgi:antitoxin HicB
MPADMRFVYPFETEIDDDFMVVQFPDVPEALTNYGPDEDGAYVVHDCLIAALRSYVEDREPIPRPSPIVGRSFVTLDALESAKLALAQAMMDVGVSNVALAKRLGVTEAVVRRLLDLDHRSHIGQVEKALAELGRRLEVRVKAA